MRIYPSLFCAHADRIRDDVLACKGADGYHIDVMDGHFVSSLACDPALVQALKAYVTKPLDVHLMVQDTAHMIDAVPLADHVTLHTEGMIREKIHGCIEKLRQRGQKVGIALNPETSPMVLDGIWTHIDQVLVMTVHPGRGGQPFQEDQLPKIRHIRDMIQNHALSISIVVDGGINLQTGAMAAAAGADTLVVGSYLFRHDPKKYAAVIQDLQRITPCF